MRWRKRQYRCREAACPRKAFTESIAEIPARARLTGRLCRQLARQVASGRSVSAVAAELGVSWPVAHRHYAAHADALLTEPEPPVVLGIDETRRGTPKWIQDPVTGQWERTERFETNFTDLSGTGGCSARSPGGPAAAVTGWLDDRGQDWKRPGRLRGHRPVRGLPVRGHQGAAARGHRRRSLPPGPARQPGRHPGPAAGHPAGLGRRGTTRDPAWANRRRLLRGRERLTEQAVHADVGRDPRPGGHRRAARHVDRQGRTPLPARPGPHPAPPGRRSAAGCSRSTTGAPAPTCPRSPPWPRPSRPGGRRSSRSSTPASPTPAPRRTTGSSKTPPASRSGSATSTTSAAEYGCTANGQ